MGTGASADRKHLGGNNKEVKPTGHAKNVTTGGGKKNKEFQLEVVEIQALQDVWLGSDSQGDLVQEILKALFKIHPVTKKAFGFERIPIAKLGIEKAFQDHAHGVSAYMGTIVVALRDSSEIAKQIDWIGKRHLAIAQATSSTGLFDPKYWTTFAFIASGMIATDTVGKQKGYDMKKLYLWRVFLLRLVGEMQKSFYDSWLGLSGPRP